MLVIIFRAVLHYYDSPIPIFVTLILFYIAAFRMRLQLYRSSNPALQLTATRDDAGGCS